VRNDQVKLVQVSSSILSELGGPSFVVAQVSQLLDLAFNHSLLIFGASQLKTTNKKFTQPTFLKNRFGFFFGFPSPTMRHELKYADLLLIHGFYLYSTLISIMFCHSKTIYIMPHGALEPLQERKSKIRKRIFRLILAMILRKRKLVFLVATKKEIQGVRRVFPAYRVEAVGLGIKEVNHKIDLIPLDDSPFTLLSLSRIHEIKRIDISIKALSILRERGYHCVLKIVGDGSPKLLRQLHDLVADLDLETVVQFLGHLEGSDKEKAIRESNMLVLPSENENFAIAVAESIVHGKPVVISSNVGMSSFVEQHSTGIVIDTLDQALLASKILDVKENYLTYQKNCLKSAQLLYWTEVFKGWLKILQEEQ